MSKDMIDISSIDIPTPVFLEVEKGDPVDTDSEFCDWSQEDYDGDIWNGDCGISFEIIDDFPSDAGMNYCFRCGKRLTETLYEDEEE